MNVLQPAVRSEITVVTMCRCLAQIAGAASGRCGKPLARITGTGGCSRSECDAGSR